MNGEAKRIIDGVKADGGKFVTEPKAKGMLRSYGIGVTRDVFCKTADEAAIAAGKIGYPVVMKLVSPQIVHKTEFEAVRLNVVGDDAVRTVFEEMTRLARGRLADLQIDGVLVCETAKGQEMIVGSLKDPQFGQMIMFGLGGINVEVFKEVSYRLAPIEEIDAREMISELKGRTLLEGFRGRERVNIDALVSTLVAVSHLLSDFPEIDEMDLNPLFGNKDGVKVADARMMLH
ncbi:MAG: acetate--CoA ligase family protein [Methanomassiliicoccales archaeon]|nr:acetate--CoA ligase family protein [Methanomassiliicoccales archaeon]